MQLRRANQWDAEIAHHLLTDQLDSQSQGFGKIFPGLRLALTGLGKGPDLMQIMAILGKEETVRRLYLAIDKLSNTIIKKHDQEKA